MTRAADRLTTIIEPIVTRMGYEFVGVEMAPHGKQSILRVYIDSGNGVLIDDCARVSHQLSGALDVEDPIRGHYQLEVSSPGIERPLFKLVDFDRFKDHTVEIDLVKALDGRRKYRGLLKGVRDLTVLLSIDDKTHEIPFDLIKKACLAVDVFGFKQRKRNGK
jgi:ribosome maturation factor RimP